MQQDLCFRRMQCACRCGSQAQIRVQNLQPCAYHCKEVQEKRVHGIIFVHSQTDIFSSLPKPGRTHLLIYTKQTFLRLEWRARTNIVHFVILKCSINCNYNYAQTSSAFGVKSAVILCRSTLRNQHSSLSDSGAAIPLSVPLQLFLALLDH